ncbi:MAG TPA: hypothetical protein VLI06_10295 [Solimonas sp.]|nr:hypothetical protein [Solimonas sp.]
MDAALLQDLDSRAAQAGHLWQQGDAARDTGDIEAAWRLYTEAHDQVMDCPRLHLEAHRRLRTVTRLRRPRGEYYTDSLLVALAPFGVFELIALALRSRVGRAALCRRGG